MNVQSFFIRQPPYYRTLYNNKQHFYLPLNNSYYGGKSSTDHKLGGYYNNNCKCSCRGFKTLVFIILIMILFPIISLFYEYRQ